MEDSLPDSMRRILLRWRTITKTEISVSAQPQEGWWMTIKATMGVTAAATKAASEDFLNLNAINAQTSTTQQVAQKDIPSSTPNAVATP